MNTRTSLEKIEDIRNRMEALQKQALKVLFVSAFFGAIGIFISCIGFLIAALVF